MKKLQVLFIIASMAMFFGGCSDEVDESYHVNNNIADNVDDVVISISKLKKTGQFIGYDEDGNKVTDRSIKDDGYYQAGVNSNYERDDDKETVIDHITGLMWQDDTDVKSITKPWLTKENYDKCTGSNNQTKDDSACCDTSGDTATTYCENLTLGDYSDWRLPTRKELGSIVDYARHDPAINPKFKYFVSGTYWSSRTYANFLEYAWVVDFWSGFQRNDYHYYYDKANSHYVRCVRDGE